MKKPLLAAVVLLPFISGGAFFALGSMFPGHTMAVVAGFTVFTLIECALLAALALRVLKNGARRD